MKRIPLILLLVVLFLSPFQAVHRAAHAQDTQGDYEVGDPVLVASARLSVYVQPDFSSGVAAQLLYGMKSYVIATRIDANGMIWYYLTDYAYGWVPGMVGDMLSLMPFSEEALNNIVRESNARIDANSGDVEAYVNRATVYLVRSIFGMAVDDYTVAVALRPGDPSYLDYLGKAYLDNQNFPEAQRYFTLAINGGRTLPNIYNRMAIALQNDDQEALAFDYYDQAIELEPNYALLYVNKGRLLYDYQDDKSGAYDLYNRAIEIDPYMALAYIYRGVLSGDSYDSSTYPQAIEDYTRAIEIDPSSALAYAHRGNLYRVSGNWELAEPDLLKAIDLDPLFEQPFWDLGGLYGAMGRYEEAVDHYMVVASLGLERHSAVLLYLSQDYVMLDEDSLAYNDIDHLVDLIEEKGWRADFSITAYMVHAAVCLHLAEYYPEKYLEAADDYASAFDVDPAMASGFYTWNGGYGVLFSQDYALYDLKAQLDSGVESADLWRQLAIEYMQRGRFDEGLDAFQHYAQLAETVPPEFEEFIATVTALTE